MNLHLLLERPMLPPNDSPNPFESPRTVSAAKSTIDPARLGRQLRDLRYQVIDFSAMAFIGILAVAVGAGVPWFLPGLNLHRRWDWLTMALEIANEATLIVVVLTFFICNVWTLISWVQFAIAWRTGRFHRGPTE